MAALGKIRGKGPFLVAVLGLALFAFIVEEFARSCQSRRNNQRQQIGQVLGENIDAQEFQKLVEEYTDVIKIQQGQSNLDDEQLNQMKDMVWNMYVQTKIVENEAEKLGLTVTDEELQNVLNQGTNQMLLQTPFVNRETGRFDANALKKFLAEYKTNQMANQQMPEQYNTIYRFWTFVEKALRQQILSQKYQSLFAHCLLSNPVEAKMAFKDKNEENRIELAAFPYSSISDDKVQISDADMKAKYDELKERFKQYVETRDIRYVDVEVEPSQQDRAALQKDFSGYAKDLAIATDPSEVVRKSTSAISYLGIPVAKTAFPDDIAARIDSMSVGQTYGPFENKLDNTMNLIKLVAKQQLPDSIQYRMIQISGATVDAAHKTADSVYTALKGGADFEIIAKRYGQTGEKMWMTTAQYQNAPSMDKDYKAYINTLNTLAINTIENLPVTQGNIILQVIDRKAIIPKYTAAVIKRNVEFSRDTYSAAYNKFSSFVSANQTADAIVKNAQKNGYRVQEVKDLTTAIHYIAGIHGTREAVKWLFDADEGDVSQMYVCGDNKHLLLVMLDKIHRVGYRSLDDLQVREMVKSEVLKDKKAEQLMAKLNGVNSLAAAKAKGGKVSPIDQVTFSAPVFVIATGSSEPALSGAVAATAKGKFCVKPVKGNAGVYLFQVVNKVERKAKFDVKAEEQELRQKALQNARNFMNELYINANVVDNRYLFF